MELILVSSCLLGNLVRYDGKSAACSQPLLKTWQQQQRLIPICPEMSGGLPCPRPAAEIAGGQGIKVLEQSAQVKTCSGEDVTAAFIQGAHNALELCSKYNIKVALLKARSPSCGISTNYNGSFQGALISGQGVTAALLAKNGIQLFDETQLPKLNQWLQQHES